LDVRELVFLFLRKHWYVDKLLTLIY